MNTIEEFEETWLRCVQKAKALGDTALSGSRYEGPAGEQLQHLSSALPIEERFNLLDLAQGKQRQSHARPTGAWLKLEERCSIGFGHRRS